TVARGVVPRDRRCSKVVVAEFHELARAQRDDTWQRRATRLIYLQDLHRLRRLILPVPHVDVGLDRIRRRNFGCLRLDADEELRAIGRPAWIRVIAEHESLRETHVLRWI